MDHAATMRALLETRERRDLKRLVERLSQAEVIDELADMRCATHGQEEAVRDRLLRALMREAEPDNVHIPWYEWDFADSSQAEQIDTDQPPEPSNTRRRKAVRDDDAPRMQDFSSSDESERERHPIRIIVDVHRPATVSPVTTPTSTTTAITMSQAGRTSVATVSRAGVYCMSTNTTSMMSGRPTMNLVPAVLNSLNQQQWVYQYEQLVRSRESQPTQPERRERATPVQAERVQESWCTPEADIDEDRRREFRGAESVASRRLDQHERVAYEKIRVTLGTRNNEHVTPRNPSPRRRESFLRPRSFQDLEEELNRTREEAREKRLFDVRGERRSSEEFENARRSHSQERRRNEPRRRSMRDEISLESLRDVTPRRRSRERHDERDEDSFRSRRSSQESREDSPRRRGTTTPVAKILRDWNIRFDGEEEKEDPEAFLEKLGDCRKDMNVSDKQLLSALPCILGKEADIWFRTIKSRVKTWSQFKREFRHQYVSEYDREDLLDDLRRRTQAKGEKIAKFLTSFRYIVSKFDDPLSRRSQVEMAYRNLLPEYRRAMSDKIVESLEDIERYGRCWERQVDLDQRYVPPPSAEKMRVKVAAYREVCEKKRSNQEEEREREEKSAVNRESESRDKMISVCGMREVRRINRGREFRGTCYACHSVGHRAFECSESICFGCHKRGHFARDCPQRAKFEQEKCQECGKSDFTVRTCPTCAPLYRRAIEENWRARPGRDEVLEPWEKKHFGFTREAEKETRFNRGYFNNSRSL